MDSYKVYIRCGFSFTELPHLLLNSAKTIDQRHSLKAKSDLRSGDLTCTSCFFLDHVFWKDWVKTKISQLTCDCDPLETKEYRIIHVLLAYFIF